MKNKKKVTIKLGYGKNAATIPFEFVRQTEKEVTDKIVEQTKAKTSDIKFEAEAITLIINAIKKGEFAEMSRDDKIFHCEMLADNAFWLAEIFKKFANELAESTK